jgi:hypothetical protein
MRGIGRIAWSAAALWLLAQAPAQAQTLPVPPTADAPGREPSEPRYLGGMWDSERFFFQIENPPLTADAKAKVDGYRAAMKSGRSCPPPGRRAGRARCRPWSWR